MTQTGTAVNAAIENKIQAAIAAKEISPEALAKEINDYGKLTLGLVLVVEKDTGDLIEGRIVTADELAGYVCMYESQIR